MSDSAISGMSPAAPGPRALARIVLRVFLATFVVSRVLAFLIMARSIPDLYLYVGGTHVHHLNHGIFLLTGVGAWLLLKPPRDRRWAAALYGFGLALTFDEFGMWLHLGGSYWQRASWDAIVVAAAALGLFAYGPALVRYRPRHWLTAALVLAAAAGFFLLLFTSLKHAERFAPRLEEIESAGPR